MNFVFVINLPCSPGEVKDGHLRVGSTRVPVFNPETRMKVPDILFYENPQVRKYITCTVNSQKLRLGI